MKKIVKQFVCLSMASSLLAGCSMMNKDEKKEDTNKMADKTPAETPKDGMNDNIDNMMKYLTDNGVVYTGSKAIDKMQFAAHEGRTFMVDGQTAYLYRMKSDDEDMKKVMKEAKDKGMVRVNVDNKEQDYAAKVNGDYLLLYDTKADMSKVVAAFPSYTPTASTNPGMNGNGTNERDPQNTTNGNATAPNSTPDTNKGTTDKTTNAEVKDTEKDNADAEKPKTESNED